VYLLNKRFKQQQQIVWQGMGGVQVRLAPRCSSAHRRLQTCSLGSAHGL
jgi:hypothetical protein